MYLESTLAGGPVEDSAPIMLEEPPRFAEVASTAELVVFAQSEPAEHAMAVDALAAQPENTSEACARILKGLAALKVTIALNSSSQIGLSHINHHSSTGFNATRYLHA
jgi:hypothetical protein